MWRTYALTGLLGCELPLVQAPLGGGPGTAELTAAVVEAGAFGILGGGYLDPGDLRDLVRRTRALTTRPFGVNLFLAPPPRRTSTEVAVARLREVAVALGLDAEPPDRPRGLPDPAEQVEVLLDEDVRAVGYAFGAPDDDVVAALHEHGRLCLGTAQSASDAQALVRAGVDVVVAQGAEAGGHRGGLDGSAEPPGLMALVPAVVDAVDVPVVAAGAVMDGRGVAAALALGAQGVALGTAFLRTPEAGTPASYRRALESADETSTVVTSAFSGRPARGVRNAYVDALGPDDLPDFPVLNYLTRPLRTASAAADSPDAQSLWAGQGVRLSREVPAAELVATLVAETEKVLARLA